MNEQETIVDIIAEKRRRADELEASSYRPHQFLRERIAELRQEADRLEAALKREMSKNVSKNGGDFGQLGDVAQLREALEKINSLCGIGVVEISSFEIGSICDAALSAPPRNCDVGTAEEQAKRFKFSKCDEPPKCRPWDECCLICFAKWAQMPYKEKEEGDK